MRRPTTRFAYWTGIRRWPSWMNTMPTITASAMNGIITTKTWSGLVHQPATPGSRPATIEAKISSEMPLPMPRWVISSPIHISSVRPGGQRDHDHEELAEGERADDALARLVADRAEQEHEADRLRGRQRHGQVARVLRDLLLADLALLLELLERRHRDRQQLQDDRGGDVGHDAEREDREVLQPAAGEQVQEAEDVGAVEAVADVLDRVDVDARHRDERRRAGRAPGSRR